VVIDDVPRTTATLDRTLTLARAPDESILRKSRIFDEICEGFPCYFGSNSCNHWRGQNSERYGSGALTWNAGPFSLFHIPTDFLCIGGDRNGASRLSDLWEERKATVGSAGVANDELRCVSAGDVVGQFP